MKRMATLLVFAAIVFLGGLPPGVDRVAAAAATATATLDIEGMTCGGCATAAGIVLRKIDGVVSANVSYEKKQTVVTYDPAKTSPLEIGKALSKQLGYKIAVRAQDLTAKEIQSGETHSCAAPADHAPATRPIKLDGYDTTTLRDEFNKASDRVRVVALLSPTCPACQHGQRVVRDVFEKFPNEPRIRGFVVWLPMLETDDERAAGQYAAAFTDARLKQVWDGKRASGEMLAKTLGLNRTAWDVYLLYAPGVRWTAEAPPAPTFWMHQLRADSGADQRVCLNPGVFIAKVSDLLRRERKG